MVSLGLAGAGLAALYALNRAGVRSVPVYIFVGMLLWICVLKSGVHATLAGVATALAIPLRPDAAGDSPARTLEHELHPLVAYAILPAFAFANAGVSLAGVNANALFQPVTTGIAFGLIVGKSIGVFSLSGWPSSWAGPACRTT